MTEPCPTGTETCSRCHTCLKAKEKESKKSLLSGDENSRGELNHVIFNTPSQRDILLFSYSIDVFYPFDNWTSTPLNLLLIPQTDQLAVVGMLHVVQSLGEHVCGLIERSDVLNVDLTIVYTFTNEVIPNVDVFAPAVFPWVPG
jgi:hypothetical protein